MKTVLLAATLLLACLVLAPTASAAPQVKVVTGTCTGVLVNGVFTGYCVGDPKCPSPSPNAPATAYYVNGAWVACSY